MFEAYFAQDVPTGQIYDEMKLLERLGALIGKSIPPENVIYNVTEIIVNTELRRGERDLRLLNDIVALGGRYDEPEDVLWVYFKRKSSLNLAFRGILWISYSLASYLVSQKALQLGSAFFSKVPGQQTQ